MNKMNLVKYAGDFWVTLSDYTQTRDVEGYSAHASVKSAIRTFVVKQSPEKYIAFRGEKEIKSIILENRNNKLFDPTPLIGHTRTALIHWSMLDALNERFKVAKEDEEEFNEFMQAAEEYIESVSKDSNSELTAATSEATGNHMESRSALLRQLRSEAARLDKEIEIRIHNKEKIMSAINALEGLELEEF